MPARRLLFVIFAARLACSQSATRPGPERADSFDAALDAITVAALAGSAQDSIQATALDSRGNVYVVGTTLSASFPTVNAWQPAFAEASLLRSNDVGGTWSRVAAPPGGVLSFAADPTSAQILFVANSSGVYKSSDSGVTWQLVQAAVVSAVTVDPGNHQRIAALQPSGTILRSLDGGATWSVGGNACTTDCTQLLADPGGSGALLTIGIGASLSRDWGATFKRLSPPGVGEVIAAVFDPTRPGWIYLAQSVGVGGSLWLTTDFGATWTARSSPATTFSAIYGLGIDASQPNVIIAEALGGFFKSTDGAASWTEITLAPSASTVFAPEPFIPLVIAPAACGSAGLLAAGSAAGGTFSVAFSPDDGATWHTPQLTAVKHVAAGAGCAFYVVRAPSSDVFAAKIDTNGAVVWATYLGGSDQDIPVSIAVDSADNLYVAGNTASTDFPATAARIGPAGTNSVFVSSFSPGGALRYSVTLGGEISNTLSAAAVDAEQSVYLAGRTDSLGFPVTSGAFSPNLQTGDYTGFLCKLSPSGALNYATYLGPSYVFANAILVDSAQEPILAGAGVLPGTAPPDSNHTQFVLKLDSTASQALESTYLPFGPPPGDGISGLVADAQGNLFLLGEVGVGGALPTPGAFSNQPPDLCASSNLPPPNDAWVAKLDTKGWQLDYTAVLRAKCGVQTGSIALAPDGGLVLALRTGSEFPTRVPLVAGPPCSEFAPAIAKLSSDGSALEYSTWLPGCGVPALATASDGSVYAGLSPLSIGGVPMVLRLATASATAIHLDGVANAFSGDSGGVAPGGLYAISISGVGPPSTAIGLNASLPLPFSLNGIEVNFDGKPAAILSTAPGQIIVASPPVLGGLDLVRQSRFGGPALTAFCSVQVSYNGVKSNVVWMPELAILPGLLTTDFPSPAAHSDYPDAVAFNADGSRNDAEHPAAAGSTVRLGWGRQFHCNRRASRRGWGR